MTMAQTEHTICDADELGAGDRVVTQIEGREIAVFNLDGEYYAYINWCPHQGGPCCEGKITGTREASYDREAMEVSLEWTHEDRIMNCPWHGWEFDLETGDCLSRSRIQLPSFPVSAEDGEVRVTL